MTKKMTKTSSNSYSGYRESLERMQPGESFFVPGAEAADLRFLYAVAQRGKMRISIRTVEQDEVYMTSGVRVWREV